MSRKTTSGPERILRAATALFARKGFSGTTTRMIATRARMNESLIFRHFPTKRDLYAAILQRKMEEDPLLNGLDDEALEPLLHSIASRVLNTIKNDPQFLRLLYFSGLEGHPLAPTFFEGYADRVSLFLSAAMDRAIANGEVRELDARLAARSFIGMVAHHAMVSEIFKFDHDRWTMAEIASNYVSIFLNGIRAKSPEKVVKKKR